MIPVTEICCRMFSRLPSVAKDGLAMLKKTTRHEQRDERRDVAQLIAQAVARCGSGGGGHVGAGAFIGVAIPLRPPPAGGPC